MRLAVLSSPDSWYARDLLRAAGDKHEVQVLPFTRVSARLGDEVAFHSRGTPLSSFDAVLVRTMPPGSLEQVVFRMDVLHRLHASGTRVVNRPTAIEIAVDKYRTLARLQAAGFDVPRTFVCQTYDEAMEGFSLLGEDVVLKPVFGSEGRGITRIQDVAIAERTFKLLTQLGAVVYMQQFSPHDGFDLRLFVMGERVYGMQRTNRLDWRTNVSRGAKSEPLLVTNAMAEMAVRAARSVDAELAGVDLLPTKDQRLLALEVNAVPGWRALGRVNDVDIATELLNWLDQG